MRRSRLTKNVEKRTRKNILLSIVGILIILFLLMKFGVGILVNFSLFLAGSKDNQSQQSTNKIDFLAPPTLNPISSATNSAKIIISGKYTKDTTIELFVNDDLEDETKTDKDGNFAFTPSLKQGSNQIKARAKVDDKKSDFSVTFTVNYSNSAPKLEVTSPSDGQTFKKDQNTASIQGSTDQGVTVTVNGFWAVIDETNNFSYTLPLQNGDNEIKIVAVDQAGNKSEKTLKVNYSQ
jgi:hypothetical protein